MWLTVQGLELQREHVESGWIFHLCRLAGDGRTSMPARIKKDSWPAGRPNIILDHTLECCSRATMSRNFDWTERVSRWESQTALWYLLRMF